MNMNWSAVSSLLDLSNPIPGDVKLKVVDAEEQVVATYEAHKIILSLHSDYFKNLFYGSGKSFKENEDNVVLIKETSKEALGDFLSFYYEKEVDFECKSLAELFSILNLAERYQVKDMRKKVGQRIASFPLSATSVVEVASTALKFCQFEDLSQALYTRCVEYLATQLTNAQSIFAFVNSSQDDTIVMRLLRDVSSSSVNCKKKPCRNGDLVMEDAILVPGMLIRTASGEDSGWREKYENKVCKVVAFSEGFVTVTFVDPPVPADPDVTDPYTIKMSCVGFSYVCDK